MGPFDLDTDYRDVVIATRENDGDYRTDITGWDVYSRLSVLAMTLIVLYISASFLIYFITPYAISGLILSVIGLGYWACYRYGTSNRLFRYRKKLTKAQLERIQRRLRKDL